MERKNKGWLPDKRQMDVINLIRIQEPGYYFKGHKKANGEKAYRLMTKDHSPVANISGEMVDGLLAANVLVRYQGADGAKIRLHKKWELEATKLI